MRSAQPIVDTFTAAVASFAITTISMRRPTPTVSFLVPLLAHAQAFFFGFATGVADEAGVGDVAPERAWYQGEFRRIGVCRITPVTNCSKAT